MNGKWCSCGAGKWIVGGGLLAILIAAVIVAAEMSVYAGGNSSHATAWYAENAPPATGQTATGQATVGKTTSSAVNYAHSLSKAFHDAATKVLPSVVMITNTPMVPRHPAPKSLPGDNSEEMPFGFKGTPFGDLFNNPDLRRSLRISVRCRRCRAAG